MEERLYLSITGDSVTIHHRPVHQFICVSNLKDAVKKVKELLAMSTEEYYSYLVNNVPFIKLEGKKTKCYYPNQNDAEDWYNKAWLSGTNKFLKEHRIKMIQEEVPLELVDQLYEDKRHKDNKGQSAFSSVVEDEDEVKWSEKPKKKLIKVAEIVEEVAPPPKKKLVAQTKHNKKKKRLISSR